MEIDVVSDVVCPWCYVGKRKLASAIAEWTERADAVAPVVRWHPFQLNPDLPLQGVSRALYLEQKFGSSAGGRNYDRLRGIGTAVGLAFAFERIERQPNTQDAHCLINAAGPLGIQDAVVEALFHAYFIDARNLSDRDTLLSVAAQAGLSRGAAELALTEPAVRATVMAAEKSARELGVQGVPFFIFNRRVAVSGAQDPAVLLAALTKADAEQRAEAASADQPA